VYSDVPGRLVSVVGVTAVADWSSCAANDGMPLCPAHLSWSGSGSFRRESFRFLLDRQPRSNPRQLGRGMPIPKTVLRRLHTLQRPKTSPMALSEDAVGLIIRLRKGLSGQGLDAGPHTICWHLEHHHQLRVSRTAVGQYLARAGLVTPEPKKRPRSRRPARGDRVLDREGRVRAVSFPARRVAGSSASIFTSAPHCVTVGCADFTVVLHGALGGACPINGDAVTRPAGKRRRHRATHALRHRARRTLGRSVTRSYAPSGQTLPVDRAQSWVNGCCNSRRRSTARVRTCFLGACNSRT